MLSKPPATVPSSTVATAHDDIESVSVSIIALARRGRSLYVSIRFSQDMYTSGMKQSNLMGNRIGEPACWGLSIHFALAPVCIVLSY